MPVKLKKNVRCSDSYLQRQNRILMTWIDYVEKTDWPNDKIVLLELLDKEGGRMKYHVATISQGKIVVVGGYFYFDLKQIYHITRYCLIDKP